MICSSSAANGVTQQQCNMQLLLTGQFKDTVKIFTHINVLLMTKPGHIHQTEKWLVEVSFLMDGCDPKLRLCLFVYEEKKHLQIGSIKASDRAAPN